jgi:hypothetical protein
MTHNCHNLNALSSNIIWRNNVRSLCLVTQKRQYHITEPLIHVLFRVLINPYNEIHQRNDIFLCKPFNFRKSFIIQLQNRSHKLILWKNSKKVTHLQVYQVIWCWMFTLKKILVFRIEFSLFLNQFSDGLNLHQIF